MRIIKKLLPWLLVAAGVYFFRKPLLGVWDNLKAKISKKDTDSAGPVSQAVNDAKK